MDEKWFVLHIFFNHETYSNRDKVLLDAVKPAVEALENEKLIQTFHFLFQPNFEILFRVRLNEEDADMEKVKTIIDEKLKPVENLCDRIIPDENYHGEGNLQTKWSYGSEGWRHTQKFLEYGSRISLLMKEVRRGRKPLALGRLDSQFNPSKLVHCFLNQIGLNTIEEAHFHADKYFERMLRVHGYFDVRERLGELEKRIDEQESKKDN